MEKKKILKIIILVIAIILLIFTVATTRKVIILESLKDKAEEYKQNSDIHMKIENERATIETFMKEDIYKTILDSKEPKSKVTQITDYKAGEGRTYWDSENGKALQIRTNEDFEILKMTPIFTFADSTSFFETIINSINSKIYKENVDGEECYVIEGIKNTNFVSVKGTINIKGYVNKETGLRTKMVETIKENGEEKEKITTYEYSFGSITEEDLQEPDRAEYTIMEN